ncbi:MAG: hypothetical protein HQL23_09215 [Candidatus Omnitrophica bacterium]|nr:hypothetical protein [Candidatus Omnitrophota bacterium]
MTPRKSHLQACWTMGRLAGKAGRSAAGLWYAVRRAKSKLSISLLSRDDIYKIIAEHIARLKPEQQELAIQEYERRLKSLTEALHALQEKISELQSSGHLNSRTMSQAIGALPGGEHFSDDERNILATILKQNIALQKPELTKYKDTDQTGNGNG